MKPNEMDVWKYRTPKCLMQDVIRETRETLRQDLNRMQAERLKGNGDPEVGTRDGIEGNFNPEVGTRDGIEGNFDPVSACLK